MKYWGESEERRESLKRELTVQVEECTVVLFAHSLSSNLVSKFSFMVVRFSAIPFFLFSSGNSVTGHFVQIFIVTKNVVVFFLLFYGQPL